jgi:hypothetical protein
MIAINTIGLGKLTDSSPEATRKSLDHGGTLKLQNLTNRFVDRRGAKGSLEPLQLCKRVSRYPHGGGSRAHREL